jgi:galactitol-specific phosphotransferase system IIB component
MPSILWSCPSTFGSSIMKKKEVLQLALQLNFWVAMNTCNSLYFYIVRV